MRTVFAASTCLALLTGVAHAQVTPPKAVDSVEFKLHPISAIKSCLSDGDVDAKVTVRREALNDFLKIQVTGLKPNLDFDMFTVKRSPLDENGQPVTAFKGFGLAWYQSDLHSDSNGNAQARIRTILLDQIFGVDVDKKDDGSLVLPPINTFHVGRQSWLGLSEQRFAFDKWGVC